MVYLAIHAHGVPLLSLGLSFRLVPVSFEHALFMMHFFVSTFSFSNNPKCLRFVLHSCPLLWQLLEIMF